MFFRDIVLCMHCFNTPSNIQFSCSEYDFNNDFQYTAYSTQKTSIFLHSVHFMMTMVCSDKCKMLCVACGYDHLTNKFIWTIIDIANCTCGQ